MDRQGADEQLGMLEQELARARRMLVDQQRLIGLGSWERDLETDEITWSDEMFRIHGYEPGAVPASFFQPEQTTIPEDLEKRRAWVAAVEAAGGDEVEETMRLIQPNGDVRTILARAAVRVDPESGRRRMIGTVQDITDHARAKHAELLLSQVVQSALEAIITLDPDRMVTSWNPAAERLYGYTAQEMIGNAMSRMFPDDVDPADVAENEQRNRRLLSGRVASEQYEARRRRKDGTLVDVEVRWSALRDSGGTIFGTVVSVRDLSELKRDGERAAHLASHDLLTGLLNRHGLEDALEATVSRGEPGAVLMLDLDNFKYVNETHGHKIGDALVAELAGILARGLDQDAILARFGGDEFCVICAPATIDHARAVADELLEQIRSHVMELEGGAVRATASIGVAVFTKHTTTAAELLADADRAMYASKEGGRDRVTVVSDIERAEARQDASSAGEHLIRSALANDRFELYVQPIVNLTTGMMTHCEVLLRMHAQDGTLISPGEFLPAAERLGLIHLIDHWVIDHALAAAAEHPDLIFEINLSGATIDDSRLEGFIARHLEKHRVDPARIVFELTETAAVGNITRARDLAASLSELGCMFAIDDFGAGFSTFYYLKHFPAKYVKIDGEFMNDPHSRMDELVIESIVRIGRDLGKLTIAEYVADVQAMERARALGVDYGQGFFFSKPFPIAELAQRPRKLLDLDHEPTEAQPLYSHPKTFT